MSVKRYGAHTNIDDFKSDWHESKDGPMVKYEDYAALEAKCAALAAENALLKKSEPAPFSKLMMEALDVYQAGAEDVPELAMLSAYKKLRDGLKTPATDAFLAEVRAQGAEMFAAYCGEENSVFVEAKAYYRSLPDAAYEFAAQLRKGVQS
ncbi:hypothetical protein [Enterobacter roggenkampii]|uniref:hypothetical protein n=1 Tax=Enterobacter roggenkampii TaxID=1812935 RepID=UPI00197AC2AD|nr:hypothetical protein [Enterobacter roggenkampii]